MTLGDLIRRLEQEPPEKRVRHGFHAPHSYRGYYDQLAFEPLDNALVGDMLKCARESVGKTFQGYKGGDFKMTEWTEVNLANYSECGDSISALLMDYILADEVKESR